DVRRVCDVGVAGIHRLLAERDVLAGADCLIVVAGMEGALPSVVGGLVGTPIVAVPTSVGYGASFGGIAALLAMLNSCAPGVTVDITRTTRGALDAVGVEVRSAADQPHRRLPDVLAVIAATKVPTAVRSRAEAVFRRLADAEARVHGCDVDEVEFHEVGAVDAIVDVVGVCAGLHALGIDELTVSPIALGGGQVQTMHGSLPVP